MKFLAVTDLHYCERNIPGDERQNHLSAEKLRKIIDNYSEGCDFIINLGDTADSQPGCSDQAELMSEAAEILGISQSCLSRKEKKILLKLRSSMDG